MWLEISKHEELEKSWGTPIIKENHTDAKFSQQTHTPLDEIIEFCTLKRAFPCVPQKSPLQWMSGCEVNHLQFAYIPSQEQVNKDTKESPWQLSHHNLLWSWFQESLLKRSKMRMHREILQDGHNTWIRLLQPDAMTRIGQASSSCTYNTRERTASLSSKE